MPDEEFDIEEFAWSKLPKDAILGSYVVLAEVLGEDGLNLYVTASPNTAPWVAMGMLAYAQDVVVTQFDMEEIYDDEDEELN